MNVDILLSKAKDKTKIEDNGCGEYFMSQVFHITESPPSPQSYEKSNLFQAQHSEISTKNATPINFINGSDLPKEHVYENTSFVL